MSDPLQNLLGMGAVKTNPFPSNSRYSTIQTATLEMADGKVIVYLRRRFVPPAERFALVREYTVTQGDRLDNLAASLIGDPELFWQLCDANGAMQPGELTATPGRRLRITLPEGIPGGLGD
jgi:hypothetical protein